MLTKRCHDDHVSVAELLDTLTHGIPDLHGFSCRGRPQEFDVDSRDDPRVKTARAVCRACPAFGPCRRWLIATPRSARPSGIVAGLYQPAPKLRPEREPRGRPSRGRAAVWLWAYMAERGTVLSSETIADAAAVGITLSSLHNARHDLGVRVERVAGPGGLPNT